MTQGMCQRTHTHTHRPRSARSWTRLGIAWQDMHAAMRRGVHAVLTSAGIGAL
jgi:hypothetical protein